MHVPPAAASTFQIYSPLSIPKSNGFHFGRQDLPRQPPPQPQPSSSSFGPSTYSASRTRLSIGHVTDGLRTPPPEMTSAMPTYQPTLPAHKYAGPVKQFDPIVSSTGPLKAFDNVREPLHSNPALANTGARSPIQKPTTTDGARNPDFRPIQPQEQQPDQQGTPARSSAASMVVPSSINSSKENLGDFAAQVCSANAEGRIPE